MSNKSVSHPSSLMHYTNIEALTCILPSVHHDSNDNSELYMNFRFSHPSQCNDPLEQNFFKESLYTNTEISNQLKASVESVEKEIGQPFIFSLIHHRRAIMQQCPLTEIPMWNMYANKKDKIGVRLRLDYKDLSTFCKNNDISLFPCRYLDKESMRKKTQNVREKHSGGNLGKQDLKEIYRQEVQYKTINWSYENEYRMVVWSNKYEIDENKLFIYQKVPLSVLKSIQISPIADFEASKETIGNMVEPFIRLGYNIKIDKSKIQIRL